MAGKSPTFPLYLIVHHPVTDFFTTCTIVLFGTDSSSPSMAVYSVVVVTSGSLAENRSLSCIH